MLVAVFRNELHLRFKARFRPAMGSVVWLTEVHENHVNGVLAMRRSPALYYALHPANFAGSGQANTLYPKSKNQKIEVRNDVKTYFLDFRYRFVVCWLADSWPAASKPARRYEHKTNKQTW